MPTIYTADLDDGKAVSFADFALKCARAIRYFVDMRDESPDVPIPLETKPSSHHDEQLAKATAEVAGIEAWDDVEAERRAQQTYDGAMREHQRYLAERSARRQRFEDMLVQVQAWTPPTSDHQPLKDFMVRQLEQEIKDLNGGPLSPPIQYTGAMYKARCLDQARRRVEYHAESAEADKRRAQERTEWAKALYQSLMQSPGTTIDA